MRISILNTNLKEHFKICTCEYSYKNECSLSEIADCKLWSDNMLFLYGSLHVTTVNSLVIVYLLFERKSKGESKSKKEAEERNNLLVQSSNGCNLWSRPAWSQEPGTTSLCPTTASGPWVPEPSCIAFLGTWTGSWIRMAQTQFGTHVSCQLSPMYHKASPVYLLFSVISALCVWSLEKVFIK